MRAFQVKVVNHSMYIRYEILISRLDHTLYSIIQYIAHAAITCIMNRIVKVEQLHMPGDDHTENFR